MRILITVSYASAFGGLHSHVRAQCSALVKGGHMVVAACRSGPFADVLRGDGVDVVDAADLDDVELVVSRCIDRAPFDLVHAHPFVSRRIGLRVARDLGVPLVVTFHGGYLDQIDQWHDSAAAIVAVSHSIRDYLRDLSTVPMRKVVVIPNGTDTSLFRAKPCGSDRDDWLDDERRSVSEHDRNVLIASRLDGTKSLVLECILACWRRCAREGVSDIHWFVAGEGSERNVLEAEANRLEEAVGRNVVRFLGWQDEPGLARLYSRADLVIGPGRCAIDAMACGTPVIAVGSRTYVGLVQGSNFLNGLYSNFGGIHESATQLERVPDLFEDVVRVIYDDHFLRQLGQETSEVVRSYLDQDGVDRRTLSLYRVLCSERNYVRHGTGVSATERRRYGVFGRERSSYRELTRLTRGTHCRLGTLCAEVVRRPQRLVSLPADLVRFFRKWRRSQRN